MDLTTDGLWTMPLNTGWVPVKAHRLQDWEKLKNMFQFTSREMCAQMGSLPLWKGATMRTIQVPNNQWSLEHCPVLCIVQFAAMFAQKCDLLPAPSPTHTFLKRPFLTYFKKNTHTPPPQRDEIWAHWTNSLQNPAKVPKPTVMAHYECP